MSSPHPIRLHQRVIITNPHLFVSCGYKGKRVDGSVRTIVTSYKPILAGNTGIVTAVRLVKTGTYRAPVISAIPRIYGDGELVLKKTPTRLENEQIHRILMLALIVNGKNLGSICIEDYNVVRDEPERLTSIWEGISRG